MIDLSQTTSTAQAVQTVLTDPGISWIKKHTVAIDAPPDSEIDPAPQAQWPTDAVRTGIYGAVSPRVVTLPDDSYRMYYTQILPRPGFPAGANDYDNSTTRILSALSTDGTTWIPEPGVRLSPEEGGANGLRVVSSDVVPRPDGGLRMYYECCSEPQRETSPIHSALSDDGLLWTPEAGERLGGPSRGYSSPRAVLLGDGRYRLYCGERDRGIISALSEDGGTTFCEEPGVRIAPGGTYDTATAFASEIVHLNGGGYLMYYAGYSTLNRAYILRALSDDGLTWRKETAPVIAPDKSRWDAAKCSEMCIFRLPYREAQAPRYGMVYEGCDGTTKNERGVWRVAQATSA
jgi:predicted GH43/DUF377 family glycosyl hydrolase